MQIEPLKKDHAADAARLVLDSYTSERKAVGWLPSPELCLDRVTGDIAALFGSAALPGFAAMEGGRLAGFITGFPIERFFSSHKGVHVPEYGHSATGTDRRLIYQRLYEAASKAWVAEGRLVHGISLFAHDAEAVDTWYWLGFGLRCVDAIRGMDAVETKAAHEYSIRKVCPEEAETLFPLHTEHCGYYRNAPLFMPNVSVESGLDEFRDWIASDDHHLWAAFKGSKPISYIRIERGCGNSFATRIGAGFHITGAFTAESARGCGARLGASRSHCAVAEGAGFRVSQRGLRVVQYLRQPVLAEALHAVFV